MYYLDKLFYYSKESKLDIAYAKTHFAKANFHRSVAKLDSAIYHYKKAIIYAQKIKNIELETSCHLELSATYIVLLNTDKATYHTNISARLVKKSKNRNQQGIVYVNLGNIYYRSEMYDLAINNYQKADSTFVKNNITGTDLTNTLYALANIYFIINDFDKSETYYNRAKIIYKKTGVTFGVEVINLKLAEILLKQQKYKEAIPKLESIVLYFKNSRNKEFIGRSSNILGKAYLKNNRHLQAIEILTKAEKINSTINNSIAIQQSKLLLGKAFFADKKYNNSINKVKEALLISKKLNILSGQEKAYFLLANNYKQLKNFKISNDYLFKYNQIKDSLSKLRNIKNLQEIETKYQTQKKEQEIALLKTKNQLVEQQKKNQRYLLLSGIGFTALASIFFFFQYKNRKKINKKLRELDVVKSNFFTNISHEFRTPLTLILGPIQKQLKKVDLKKDERNSLEIIQRNSNRLLSLVDQLLDISKLETGNLKVQVSKNKILPFINTLVDSFSFLAKEKQITFTTTINSTNVDTWFDKDAIDKMVLNLLSNAIKYTPEKGKINCIAFVKNGKLYLEIKNTGKQLTKKELKKIFIRFYQADEYQQGAGLGLSLVKELVTLYKGTISAKSTEKWTTFNIILPISKTYFNKSEISIDKTNKSSDKEINFKSTLNKNEIDNTDYQQVTENPILLIVEDNADVRTYLSSIFKTNYTILQAKNGQEGVDMALKHIPDFIISDIMMPVKNGIELCNQLKTDERTSHIPIILLTAKAGEENEIEGIKTGADDYITKPFNDDLLQLKVNNILAVRKKLQELYSKEAILIPKNIVLNSVDKCFLEKIKKILDNNLIESSFNIKEFSNAVGMSRMQLHRKLKALTGLSASELIRSQRLKLAAHLLKKSDTNVSQIGYSVGFNNPGYFSKCFKEMYGCRPSEYTKIY